MIKRMVTAVFTLVLLSAVAIGPAGATLSTIGTADYNGGSYNLIYDNASPFGSIVWLDYSFGSQTGGATWWNQMAWASGLNGPGVITYNLNPGINMTWGGNWRMPSTVDGPSVYSNDGSTAAGYNNTNSELAHLYYTELNNLGMYDTNGNLRSVYGLVNTGSFSHLESAVYRSGTDYALNPDNAWYFAFYTGGQSAHEWAWKGYAYYYLAMAVRPGELETSATVPEPSTFLLLGAGLGGLAFWRKRRG
jgi:hypothetical protein